MYKYINVYIYKYINIYFKIIGFVINDARWFKDSFACPETSVRVCLGGKQSIYFSKNKKWPRSVNNFRTDHFFEMFWDLGS